LKSKFKYSYSHIDVLLADPVKPLAERKRKSQLELINASMLSIERNPNPTLQDWEIVSDIVNFMQSLLEMREIEDPDDLIGDAVAALAKAGQRHIQKNVPIRFDGKDLTTIRGVIEDYAMVGEHLSARTMITAHRMTEKRVNDILTGKTTLREVRAVV
jgi:hypothetical protein